MEILIASTFKLVLKVLIELQFSPKQNYKAKWVSFYRHVFLCSLFVNLVKYFVDDSLDLFNER